MDRMRILIVDDHPLFRKGLCWALQAEGDFEIVGEAASGQEAVALAYQLEPDVVLLDLHLPDASGVDVARTLRLRLPTAAVVLLSAYDDEEQLFEAVRVGAAGFFLKDTSPEPLIDGLRRAARGESLLDERALERPLVASRVLREFREREVDAREIEPLLVPLSTREMEVLQLIAHGHTNKGIGQQLVLSEQTIKNHITAILKKLAVNDRTQAVVCALRHGWIQVGRA
jgi:DNA-binding NarL/FixJ family response regulator